MSLINQMLKDLESRRNPELRADGVLPGSSPTVGNKGMRPLNIILIVLVVLLALGLSYTLWSQKNMTKVATTATPVPAQETLSQAAITTPGKVEVTVRPKPAITIITPRQPELVKKAKSKIAAAVVSNSRLYSITPSVIDGSQQLRTLTIKGEELSQHHSIIVSWADREKVLPSHRVEWVDNTTARIKLVTGNTDELWRVALVRPDGSHSKAVEFEVIASPYADSASTKITSNGRMEKIIHPPSNSEQADKLYQQGYHALQQRKTDIAEKLWQQALKTEAEHVKSREGLIALYLSQGRKVETSKLLEEGIKRHPDNTHFAMLYARLLTEQGNTTGAIATLEQAMDNAAQKPEFFSLLAALYQQQRDYSKSIAAYQRALNMQPQQSNWWMGLGISLEGAGKQPEAISSFEEALQRGMLSQESHDYVQQRLQALK